MTGRNARHNVIAAYGNYSVYTAGQAIWSSNGDCLVRPGQLVVYSPTTNLSLGAGITVASNPEIVIGVGFDTNDDGVSETIRACFGDKLFGYNLKAASAEPPACGVSPIKDFFFDCTQYNNVYTVAVTIEDHKSRSEMPYNKDFTYVVSISVETQPCETCETGVACKIVGCKIVDAFRGEPQGSTSITKREKFTENAIKRNLAAAGFEVVPLYGAGDLNNDYTKEWCVALEATDCDSCVDTDTLFDGMSVLFNTDETVTFTDILSNVGGTATLAAQLPRVVKKINDALDGRGYAVLIKGVGKCCSYKIQVNSCFTDFVFLDDQDQEIAPCSASNPFDFTIADTAACKDCPPASAATPPVCGIRIIAKPQDYNCAKYPTSRPIVNFIQEINVYPLRGFKEGRTHVKEIQAGANPRNLGYHWQYIDYVSDNGGIGRGHREYNDAYGSMHLPHDLDRINASKIKCPTTYCSYSVHHDLPYRTSDVHGGNKYTQGLTSIIIPSADTSTRTSFEAILNPYISSSPNPKIATITCGSDQDQNTYNDYNGNRFV